MTGSTAAEPTRALSPIVVAVGLGADREAELVEQLEASGVIAVGVRCLSADQVAAATATRRVEAALLADDLYRLDATVLHGLRVPVVLLTDEPDAGRWPRRRGLVTLPLEAGAAEVRAALAEAMRGRMIESTPASAPRPAAAAPAAHARGRLVWVTKYQGSHGATTVAANILVRGGRAVLVELDPGAVAAAFLDANQDRAVHVVIRTAPASSEEWEQVLTAEIQPIAATNGAGLLAGTWRLEERAALSPAAVRALLDELRRRYRLVIVDLGLAGLLGAEAALVRVVQTAADQILVVGSTDVVGVWQTQAALELLGADDERVALVLTRYDRRRQYPVATIAAQLKREPLAVIPYDYAGSTRALDDGRPLALEPRSAAGRALRELADRVRVQRAGSDVTSSRTPSGRRRSATVRLLEWWRDLRVSRVVTPPAGGAPWSASAADGSTRRRPETSHPRPDPVADHPEAVPVTAAAGNRSRRARRGRAS
jgi:Flp pilus assembly CpaE family ATPase